MDEYSGIDLTVDWNEVPLLAANLAGYPNASHRCSPINPELKNQRREALKLVTTGIDDILRPAGYTRTKLTWSKGPVGAPAPRALPRPSIPRPGRGFLSRVLGTTKETPAPYVSTWGNDGAVSLSLQKESYGTGFFVNVYVRNAGRHDRDGSATTEGKAYRGQCFMRDLPRNYTHDLYHYVRLVEDPRYLTFLLNLVEDRVLPFLEAYADTRTRLTELPLVREIEAGRPLRLPDHERWRMLEFTPTPQQYEDYAASPAAVFGFALRDGRAFYGAIIDVAPGRFHLSWRRPKGLPAGMNTDPLPPDEWVPTSQIVPGSLSYADRDTGHTIVVDLSIGQTPTPDDATP